MSSLESLRENRAQTKSIRRRSSLLAAAVAGVLAGSALVGTARAGTFTWDINDSGNWSLGTNWVGNIAPTGGDATDNLIFGGISGSYISTVDGADPFTINGLTLSSSSTAANTINFTNTQGISLAGVNPFITQNGTGAFVIDAPLVLTGDTTFGGTGTGMVTLNGLISGNGAVNFTGGVWRIGNINNSFTGAINIGSALVEIRPNGAAPQFIDILPASTATLLGSGANAININGGTLKLTTVGGSTTPDFQAANIRINNRAINFGVNGGLLELVNTDTPTTQGGNVADGTNLDIRTTTGATAPAIVRWNGGQQGLSEGDDAPPAGFLDPDWQLGENVLRLDVGHFDAGVFVSDSGTGPLRVEMLNGAMIQLDNNAIPDPNPAFTYVMPVTLAGPAGGNPTSGPAGTLHSGNTKTVGRVSINDGGLMFFEQGLSLEGALQFQGTNGSRGLDGNITVRGLASGNPGYVSFSGRSTGQNFLTSTDPPNQPGQGVGGVPGHHVFWLGHGENDTLTIEDGGIAVMDIRFRSDQNNAHGTVLNAKTVLQPGGTLRFTQSLSRYTVFPTGVTPAVDIVGNVGNHIVQGNIEGQGSSAKDSVLELYLPFDNTYSNGRTDVPAERHLWGGVEFVWDNPLFPGMRSQLVVNGTGTGGLQIKSLARPNALFQNAAADPVSNLDKINNLLTVARLSNLTGTGGYLTAAPTGVTWTFPAGGEWANDVPVGLKIVNSNTVGAGVDVSLGGLGFSHNIFVDAGATLDATGSTLGPASVTAGLGLVHGNGTIAGGAIINTGGAIAGGFAGVGTLTVNGNVTINGALSAELAGMGTGRVSVQGNLNLPGGAALNVTGSDLASDFYTLANYTGALSGTFGAINGAPAGYVLDYGTGSNSRITFFKANSRLWTGAVNSNFDNATGNWYPGVFADGNAVQFDDTATNFNVSVVGTVSPDGMKVLNATNNYTIGGAGTIAGAGGLTKLGAGQLTISGAHTYSGPVVIGGGTLNIDSINDTATPQPSPLGQGNSITLGSAAGKATVNFTGPGGSIARTINVVNADLLLGAGKSLTISGDLAGSGPLATKGAGTLTLSGNSAGYTGNLLFTGGTTVTASAAGSLGSGQVAVGEGTLASSVRLNYNAAGAYAGAGAVDITTLSSASVGAALGAGDRIKVNANAVLLPSSFGGSLDRATNLNAQTGAIIAENGAGQNDAILNRGTASDLFFGISGSVLDSMNLGATPGATAWRGLSTTFFDDGTLSGGTITASSDFILQTINNRTLTLGGSGLTITGGPKNANVQGSVRLAGSTNSFSGITFRVNQGSLLELMSPNTLGSGGNIGSVAVLSGGTLRPMDPTSANGGVNVNSGGILDVISNLSGSGALNVQSGGILQLSAANALSGTQLTPANVPSGAVLRLVANDIAGLNNVVGSGVIFELFGSAGNRSQSSGITLNNSLLTQDNNDVTYVGPLTIGATGGTLASTTGRTLTYASNISTPNPITIGSTSTIDGNAKLGVVSLGGSLTAPFSVAAGTMRVTGTLNSAATVNLPAGTLDFGNGAVLNKDYVHNIATNNGVIRVSAGHAGTSNLSGTGSFTLGNGRELIGSVSAAAAAPAFVNTISLPINIEATGGTLTVDREGPTAATQGLVRFADVRLAPDATLTLRRISENSVADITLQGNATIVGNNTNNQTRIGNVNATGRTLTMGGTQNLQMVGPISANTSVVNINSATTQLNSTTFGSYTSAFALNGNTYHQKGTLTANVSGGNLPGLTGSGATTISANPGQGTFLGTGGQLAINATAPDATVIARGVRLTGGGTAAATNVVGNLFIDTSAELEMTAANSLNFTNVTMAPHSALVIGPNTNTAGQGLGLTSFVRFVNNPPTVTNDMVSPRIIRKTSGGNEGFFLTYNTTSGFTTATADVTVTNPAAGGATMPAATLASDIVVVDGADTNAAPNIVTVPMVASELTFWALKTDQDITGFGTKLNIGSGGIIFAQGNNQNRTIEPDINFGSAEAFISGRSGGANFNNDAAALITKNRNTLAGNVAGTGGLTKFAGGDLHLTGFNTFTGPVTIQRGRLVISGGTGIGTGATAFGGDGRNNPLTINANSSSNNGNNNHHPSILDLSGTTQSVNGVDGNGGVTSSNFGASFIIDKTAGTSQFSGSIYGAVAIFKRGAGTQILSPTATAPNTYDSGTFVEAGTLLVNNATGSGTGTSTTNVNTGATLGGSGLIGNFVNVQNGAHLAPGAGPATVGTLTIEGASFENGVILDYEGDGSGVDRLNIGVNGFGISGVTSINMTNLGGLGSGDYIILDYTNGSPSLANFSLSAAPAGYTWDLVHDEPNTNFLLHVVSSGPPQWIVDANGSWGNASNWQGGIPAAGGTANFLGKITAPRTVTLDGNRSVATVNFDNANKYTIAQGSSGTLTVTSGINVVLGTHEISAPLSLSGAAGKSGPGTLIISGVQNHAAGAALNVTGGNVNLNSNAGTAATAGTAASANLALNVVGSTVVLGANQDLRELSLSTGNPGAQGFDLASPSTAGAFRSVRIYAADLAAARTSLTAAIKNALTNPGDGIYDSGMAAHAGSALGIAQVADVFGTQNIFIRPTKVGDLNLDGTVTISDFIDLASHFNSPGGWQEGDLNYDGSVTISDFIDLASNFNTSYSGSASSISPEDRLTLSSFASSVGVDPSVIGSAVPEPGTLSLAALGAIGLLARRRRRSA